MYIRMYVYMFVSSCCICRPVGRIGKKGFHFDNQVLLRSDGTCPWPSIRLWSALKWLEFGTW